METLLDLYGASREDLIALIVAQRERITAQEQEIGHLRAELATHQAALVAVQERVGVLLAALEASAGDDASPRPTTMPGRNPPGHRLPRPEPPSRTRRAHGCGRQRMTPTARQGHAFAQCPHGATPLRGGAVKRTRAVIELAPGRVAVTAHGSGERRCPRCHGRWLPEPGMAGAVVGQGRFGVGLLRLIAVLRAEVRLPVERIPWHLASGQGLALSVGAIVAASTTLARRAAPRVAQIHAAIRASPVRHAAETGWRQNGHNGYAGTFATPAACAFVRGSRERAVREAASGDDDAGVLVSDCSAASTSYDGRHQSCWAHLLRDGDDLVAHHRTEAGVVGWAESVQGLYRRATADTGGPPAHRRQRRQAYEAELGALCAPFLGVADAPQRVVCERITTHLSDLFVFVEDPAVPATTNAAARSLRHLVTSRTISGGTRSAAGTATKMTLAALFGTWRLPGLNPLAQCRALLSQSQV